MKVSVNDLSGCTKEVQVEVPADLVQGKVDELYRRLSQEAKLPGFRKGKAPMDVIRKQYKSNVREEMVQHQLPEFFREALSAEKIAPVAQPQITHLQFEEGAAMKFVATVEVKPPIALKDYKGLKIKKGDTSVQEGELDKALEALRDQLAEFILVTDRAAKNDDLVVLDFEGKIGGKPFEGGKADRYPVLLGSQGLLKDFESNLIGMKQGETKTFTMTFPPDYGKKDVAGKEAQFTVTLRELKEKKLPAVDDEFAQKVAGAGTVQELRGKLEAQLRNQKETEERSKMIEQIGEKLISDHKTDVPQSLVLMEQQRLVKQGVDRMRGQGLDVNKLAEEQKREFVEKLRPVAAKNVHMALIVERIAEAEKIVCDEKDYDAYVMKIAQNVGQPPESVKRYLAQQGSLESVREWIQYEKTLDFLIAQGKLEKA